MTNAWAEAAPRAGEPIPVIGDLFRVMLNDIGSVDPAIGLWHKAGGPGVLLRERLSLPCWVGSSGHVVAGTACKAALGILTDIGLRLANLVDDLRDGREIDFLDFGLGATRLPTVNIADAATVLGIAALAALSCRGRRSPRFDRERHAG